MIFVKITFQIWKYQNLYSEEQKVHTSSRFSPAETTDVSFQWIIDKIKKIRSQSQHSLVMKEYRWNFALVVILRINMYIICYEDLLSWITKPGHHKQHFQ